MRDLISRQAAIDTLSFDKEMLSRALDDMDVVDTEREKYSWGLGLIESNIYDIEELPSAQPGVPSAQAEPHYCRGCKWSRCHINADKHGKSETYWWCLNWDGETDEEGYCHEWERRTDERLQIRRHDRHSA